MNKSQRIRVDLNKTTGKFIKTRLEQNTKMLEILSLKINQKDLYQNFNADYGVIVGRVLANGGVGIPNAKISIFIPITEEDKSNADIYAIYPYEKPYDKNRDGKRYNLLPRVGKEDPKTGAYKPKQPFGSFPIKEEVVTNETFLEVYDKYYKYSTITNNSGDYMLFGVPVGTQTVHMSVDITDIGKYSMSPIDMVIQLGYSPNLFTSTGLIKPQNNLEDLPHIETQEISVNVVPFWGDTVNFEIGITRQDFRIRATLISNFVVFGSYFTMGRLSVNGNPDNNPDDVGFYRLGSNYDDYNNNVDVRTNRVGDISLKVYSYLQGISQTDIDNDIATSGITINPQTDIYLVDSTSYFEYKDSSNGQFIISVPCNRKKVVTDEFGNEIVVSDDNPNGVFTEFLGMVIAEHEDITIDKEYADKWTKPNSPNNGRVRFKIPQQNYSIRSDENNFPDRKAESDIWRKEYFKFIGGEFYSVSQFFPTRMPKNGINNNPDDSGSINTFVEEATGLDQVYLDRIIGTFKVAGEDLTFQQDLDFVNIVSGGSSGATTNTTFVYDFPWNFSGKTTDGIVDGVGDLSKYFGGQWLNFSMYFPQINWTYDYTSPSDARDQNTGDPWLSEYYKGRNGENGEWFTVGGSKIQPLIAGEYDTSFFSRAQSLSTTFVQVPKEDAVNMTSVDLKGLSKYELAQTGITLTGSYQYRTPTYTFVPNRNELNDRYLTDAYDITYPTTGENPRFFKGMFNANALQLLFDLNFI